MNRYDTGIICGSDVIGTPWFKAADLMDTASEKENPAERLDQLQIAKSDDLDKNFTRGFERGRTCLLLPHTW